MRWPTALLIAYLIFVFHGAVLAQTLEDGLYTTIYMGDEQLFLRLCPDKAPMTVANFVGLAEGTITNAAFDKGRPFFDGSKFDRVVPGHVIQGGVPDSNRASSTGYTLPNEIDTTLSHNKAGMLGMANGGPHTNDNVFYITLGDRSYLDGDYTLFGELVYGHPELVALNTRIDSIRIVRIGNWEENYKVDDAKLNGLIRKVQESVDKKEAQKDAFETHFIAKSYPDLVRSASGWLYKVIAKGSGKKIKKLTATKVSFSGSTPQGLAFMSDDHGDTTWREEGVTDGHVFNYIPAETKINPGLDEAILQMKRGAEWIVVLPPTSGYGNAGYYPKEKPGEKRFHFSPNTTLIYTVKVAGK